LKAWRLFITANAPIIESIDSQLREAEQIPLNWYDVLIELYEAKGHRLRMSDLAERVLLTRSGLTRLVDTLEKQDYIVREIDPEDRRGFFAVLTDDGKQAMQKAWPTYASGINMAFAAHLSDVEAQLLIDVFERMIGALAGNAG
ncbi:MAG: MarR family transcriptional regulator, partial [Chloroflexi bacterium]|nr:MarR family transcriptional regulator [Chloroflexota bacterium]